MWKLWCFQVSLNDCQESKHGRFKRTNGAQETVCKLWPGLSFFSMISVWIICVIKAIKTLYQLVQTKCGLTNTLHCSSLQDLDFASQLVKRCHVSTEVLLEALRLLLPTLPESELLSISDALCPKQHPPSGSAEQEHPGYEPGSEFLSFYKNLEVHTSSVNSVQCFDLWEWILLYCNSK